MTQRLTQIEREALKWALLPPELWDAVPAAEAEKHRQNLMSMIARPCAVHSDEGATQPVVGCQKCEDGHD